MEHGFNNNYNQLKQQVHFTLDEVNDDPNIFNLCLSFLCVYRVECCVLITTFKILGWCLVQSLKYKYLGGGSLLNSKILFLVQCG